MVKLRSTQILFYVQLLLVLILHSSPSTCQEVEDEREFNYVEGSEKGPEKWGEIHPEWEKCNTGEMQSPIDLLNERVSVVSHLGRLKRSYKPSNATIINRGHDIMLKWVGGAGSIKINGTDYILQQCHWHSPSEHTINGKRFDLEVHLVHESLDKKIAVVGITYIIGRPDSFLSDLLYHIRSVADTKKDERVVGVVNPREIKLGSRKYYRYIGSLTIPPCTENVLWTIIRKVRTVSREQVRLLREAVHDDSNMNSRPVQPIRKHKVHLFRPDDD
ncbi:Alpha carbonic anhydrase [Macleaya cordata]|uniref:Carbonic anhydrase n=1 Tax=Macleaya cordata TaxID=56857 RepID=A0A200R5P3_MACCD|nr:Alpha carbonic anhydrase [Macleaya cordata]